MNWFFSIERGLLTNQARLLSVRTKERWQTMEHPTGSAGQKTILVVDDDSDILTIVREILAKDNHYNILTAPAGADALSQSINFKDDIHLLLSDFQMPEMSGVELATR